MTSERFVAFVPMSEKPFEAAEFFNVRINKGGNTFRIDKIAHIESVFIERLDNPEDNPYVSTDYDVEFYGKNVFSVKPRVQFVTNVRIVAIVGVDKYSDPELNLVNTKVDEQTEEVLDFFEGTLIKQEKPKFEKKPEEKTSSMEAFLNRLKGV